MDGPPDPGGPLYFAEIEVQTRQDEVMSGDQPIGRVATTPAFPLCS